MTLSQLILVLLALAGGLTVGFFLRKRLIEARQLNLEEQGKKLIENALDEAERIKKEAILHAKDEEYQLKISAEQEIKELKSVILSEEKRLSQKAEQIERKIDLLDKREIDLLNREKSLSGEEAKIQFHRKEIDMLIEEQRIRLEKIAGSTRDEARQLLTESIESEARMEAAKAIVRIENEMKIQADRKAKIFLLLPSPAMLVNMLPRKLCQ